MNFRTATPDDARTIAHLHAESWRAAYRGIYSDGYLDNEVHAERLASWLERFEVPHPDWYTLLVEDGAELIGFAHTELDEDPKWGALVDNLHVTPGLKRSGIGTELMARTAAYVLDQRPGQAMYLWVLEANAAAQAFYDARGGTCVERADDHAPDGTPIVGLRYAWPDPKRLVRR